MVIDPGVRNLGILVFDSVTGHVKLWAVKSLLPMGRAYLPWQTIPHAVRDFLAHNEPWFRCARYLVENQFVARMLVQRVEVALQCYLELRAPARGAVQVYPASRVRSGVGVPNMRDWAKNKAASVAAVAGFLEQAEGPWVDGARALYAKADARKKHNLADTFLAYWFYTRKHPLDGLPSSVPSSAMPSLSLPAHSS